MRFISGLIKALILIILGYWLAVSQVANNTIIGDGLDAVMEYLPLTGDYWDQAEWESFSRGPETQEETSDLEGKSQSAEGFSANNSQVDDQFIRNEVFNLTNELRQNQGLNSLTYNADLELAGDIRAEETIISFSHTRPNGSDPFTVLTDDQNPPNYQYSYIGENLGMATYHSTDEYMAQLIFDGWMNSEGHYENMVKAEYTEMGVGVAYDGEFLYLTQFFGRPM